MLLSILSACSYGKDTPTNDAVSSEYDSGQLTAPTQNQLRTESTDSANAF